MYSIYFRLKNGHVGFLYTNVNNTVDGINPANQLRLVVYPIIYKALHIPGGKPPDF